ncbi:MAG: hypothetical protein VR64_23945 [Desulfatitalea sp. BRH_c12]|nr:MAG: hypothetical protein VR64_23945 [Desulfatitalea sp. BRH_c12]
MAFDRPDLKTLIARTTTDIDSRFAGTYNTLRRRATAVFARVLAGLAHGLYGYIDWTSRQILPDTQDEEALLRFGAMLGVTRKGQARAAGTITFSGVDGQIISSGTVLQRSDGIEYATGADVTIVAGTASVTVTAAEAGVIANTDAGTSLALVSPIDGVNLQSAVAAGGLTGGLDIESLDAYRQRVLTRTGTNITGANAAVYRQWATEVSAVTRAWVYEQTPAAGSVTVLFVCDDLPVIIPDAAKITEVADYLEEHFDPLTGYLIGRPVNATLIVAAPAAQAIDFTILPSPNTAAVRAAIAAELADMLRRDSVPGGTILLSHIREAISISAGENDYTLTAPAANVVCSDGTIATMGVITWA